MIYGLGKECDRPYDAGRFVQEVSVAHTLYGRLSQLRLWLSPTPPTMAPPGPAGRSVLRSQALAGKTDASAG